MLIKDEKKHAKKSLELHDNGHNSHTYSLTIKERGGMVLR